MVIRFFKRNTAKYNFRLKKKTTTTIKEFYFNAERFKLMYDKVFISCIKKNKVLFELIYKNNKLNSILFKQIYDFFCEFYFYKFYEIRYNLKKLRRKPKEIIKKDTVGNDNKKINSRTSFEKFYKDIKKKKNRILKLQAAKSKKKKDSYI